MSLCPMTHAKLQFSFKHNASCVQMSASNVEEFEIQPGIISPKSQE